MRRLCRHPTPLSTSWTQRSAGSPPAAHALTAEATLDFSLTRGSLFAPATISSSVSHRMSGYLRPGDEPGRDAKGT